MLELPRFTKINSRYAPQIFWQIGDEKIPLHPHEHNSPHSFFLIPEEEIDWQEMFTFFSFASLADLSFWVVSIKKNDGKKIPRLLLDKMLSDDFFSAAGFSLDNYLSEDFFLLHSLREKISAQTFGKVISLCDDKNLSLRLLTQFLRRVDFAHAPNLENFLLQLTKLFLPAYIKNNSLREIFKILNDLSFAQNLHVLEAFTALHEGTHIDQRKSLNSLYLQTAMQIRYPMLDEFKKALDELVLPLEKKQKNILFEFHPTFEQSRFKLIFTIQKQNDIVHSQNFFTDENKIILQKIIDKLLQG